MASLEMGESTNDAILRIGLDEMFDFASWYFPDGNFEESEKAELRGQLQDTIAARNL